MKYELLKELQKIGVKVKSIRHYKRTNIGGYFGEAYKVKIEKSDFNKIFNLTTFKGIDIQYTFI